MNSDSKLSLRFSAVRSHVDTWAVSALAIVVVVLFPVIAVVGMATLPADGVFPHLMSTVLPRYLTNSLLLMVAVGVITGMVGTVTAWLVVMCSFPGRAWLEWALLLPLAVPAYIAAYALVDFWEYAGPAQTAMRELFGWTGKQDYWFPEVRSQVGAILVLSLSLYPYVYLLARAAFRDQSANVLEVARTLGCGFRGRFLRIAVPLARPAILGGVAIVMMETLSDFGAVEYFAVQTLTTGIMTTWLEASNVAGAAQLSSLLLTVVVILVVAERLSRHKARFYQPGRKQIFLVAEQLRGPRALAATLTCSVPVLLGFLMPVSIILYHSVSKIEIWGDVTLWASAVNTLYVSVTAGLVTVAAAVLLVFGIRVSYREGIATLAPLSTIGYAIPGIVLGIGILIPLAALDHAFADLVLYLTGTDPGLLITGSGVAIILAYSIRFFALAFSSTDSAFERWHPAIGDAARSLGKSPLATVRRVYLPLVKGGLLTAGLLVFVDCVKELPATLLLRPFGFNTLATRTYDFASLEDLSRASSAAVVVILVGLVSVAIMAAAFRRQR